MRTGALRDADPGRAAHTRPCSCPNARPACMCRLPTTRHTACLASPPCGPSRSHSPNRDCPPQACRRPPTHNVATLHSHLTPLLPGSRFCLPKPACTTRTAFTSCVHKHSPVSTRARRSMHVCMDLADPLCFSAHSFAVYPLGARTNGPPGRMPQHGGAHFFSSVEEQQPYLRTAPSAKLTFHLRKHRQKRPAI